MEHFDVLNEDGEKTGHRKPRKDVHRDGDWHRAVHVWIINGKGELLLQRRAKEKEAYPDKWDISSAGHICAGDDPITSAMREMEEELGLVLEERYFEYLFTVKNQIVLHEGAYINNELDDIYLVTMEVDIAALTLQQEEVSAVQWMDFAEYEKHIDAQDPEYVPLRGEYKKRFFGILHERSGARNK
jgi:isopentenyldiphosphate isomerase